MNPNSHYHTKVFHHKNKQQKSYFNNISQYHCFYSIFVQPWWPETDFKNVK